MTYVSPIDRQAVSLQVSQLEDEGTRAVALATSHMLALDAAASATDNPTSLAMLDHYRRKVQMRLNWLRESDYSASGFLDAYGPNGFGPAIEDACRSARYHGFDWQKRREELLASCRPAQVARSLTDEGSVL